VRCDRCSFTQPLMFLGVNVELDIPSIALTGRFFRDKTEEDSSLVWNSRTPSAYGSKGVIAHTFFALQTSRRRLHGSLQSKMRKKSARQTYGGRTRSAG
jgi:hypothetical protein